MDMDFGIRIRILKADTDGYQQALSVSLSVSVTKPVINIT